MSKAPLLREQEEEGSRVSERQSDDSKVGLGKLEDDCVEKSEEEEETEEQARLRVMCFCRRIWNKYDRNFLTVYSIAYFNAGLKFL